MYVHHKQIIICELNRTSGNASHIKKSFYTTNHFNGKYNKNALNFYSIITIYKNSQSNSTLEVPHQ